MTLTCPVSMEIRIEDAVYGHYDDQACSGPVSATNCHLEGDFEIVDNLCTGLNSCDIVIGWGLFTTDPCPNTLKYLEVNYTCVVQSKSTLNYNNINNLITCVSKIILLSISNI